jgi:hypothetical protein
MQGMIRRRIVTILGACLLGGTLATPTAQGTSDHPAALLLFPKVIADGTRDTIIQIVNSSDQSSTARCVYLNAALQNPASPPGPSNPPVWQATPFALPFKQQQPLSWVLSQGHVAFGAIGHGTVQINPCCGEVPAVTMPFQGELLCVVTDSTGHPTANAGNLLGTATIKHLASGDTSKYNAIGLAALSTGDGNDVLCLGGGVSSNCPRGAEYQGCPLQWALDHLAYGAQDPVIGAGSAVRTNITVVPCSQDFSTPTPSSTTINFDLHNGMEQPSTTVTCWADLPLNAISPQFNASPQASPYAQTMLTPTASGACFLMVAEEFHDSGGAQPVTSSAALNPQMTGVRSVQDTILLPTRCAADAQCGAGFYCSQVGVCVQKRDLGVVCAADPIDSSGNHQCVSAHCAAGVCASP